MLAAAFWSVFGVVNLAAGEILAQVGDTSSPVPVVFTGIGASTVVGVMAWVVKKVVSGEMVPLPIRILTEKMDNIITVQAQEIVAIKKDNDVLRDLVKAGTEAQFAMYEHLRSTQFPVQTRRMDLSKGSDGS